MGELRIGDLTIGCAVLEGNLPTGSRSGSGRLSAGEAILFIAPINNQIFYYVNSQLLVVVTEPIRDARLSDVAATV